MNRRDWREVSVGDVQIEPRELRRQLLPVLSVHSVSRSTAPGEWATQLVSECRYALSVVLPFSAAEQEFFDRLLDHGEIRPALLGVDQRLSERVQQRPALLWKVFNVNE
jgi:hypothetical protein